MDQEAEASDSVPTIRFTNVEALIREKWTCPGDTLRVTNVSLADFNKIDEEYEWNKIRISQYIEHTQCMLVTITTAPHENLYADLYYEISGLLHDMGLRDSYGLTGAVTCYSQGFHSGGGNGSAASADASITPDPAIRRGFPTLVIEAGCSRSLASMRDKAEWWFQVSDHDVKIVLLAKFDERQRSVVLERWEERQREQPREGEAGWVAACQQTITVTQVSADPRTYQLTGGDLVLDLELLLLRSPRQGEENFVAVAASYIKRQGERVLRFDM